MKYIFKTNETGERGEYPVDTFQVCWYSDMYNWDCFDESVYTPENFGYDELSWVETEENKNDSDRTRVFANMKNGDTYELILRKVDRSKCSKFNGR